jgi:hypothetical protein
VFTYIPGSYTAVGNDGNHFNRGLNELPNTKVSDEIATALYYSSDHLPVYADFLVETLTGLLGDPFNVTNDFELFQNYPNPFNPATTIKFSIPSVDDNLGSAGIVELRVFDILGREVANLLNEPLTAGNYTVNFKSGQINRQITSGVYYYQLRFGEFIETKKMIVLK